MDNSRERPREDPNGVFRPPCRVERGSVSSALPSLPNATSWTEGEGGVTELSRSYLSCFRHASRSGLIPSYPVRVLRLRPKQSDSISARQVIHDPTVMLGLCAHQPRWTYNSKQSNTRYIYIYIHTYITVSKNGAEVVYAVLPLLSSCEKGFATKANIYIPPEVYIYIYMCMYIYILD